MPDYYLGLAIGPLTATQLEARKTREAWTASYLFSRLMYHLIQAIEAPTINGQVLAPRPATATAFFVQHFDPASAPENKAKQSPLLQVKDKLTERELFGTGIYPDKLFAFFPGLDASQLNVTLKEIKETAIIALAGEVLALHDRKKKARLSLQEATEFYLDYFRIAAVWVPGGKIGSNILKTLNELIDSQELAPAYMIEETVPNPLLALLDNPYTTKLARAGLVRHPFNSFQGQVEAEVERLKGGVVRLDFDLFPSTAHIASVGLYHQNPGAFYTLQSNYDLAPKPLSKNGKFEDALTDGNADDPTSNSDQWMKFFDHLDAKNKSNGGGELLDSYQQYHKYFCIVHADGDRFGDLIDTLGTDPKAVTKFSEDLAGFAAEAAGIINDYGGKPIFVGGDDLLFFCPLVAYRYGHKDTKTVFDLLNALDDRFEKHKFKTGPTLSYGLTISHYKYPLFEAMRASYATLLRAKATKWPDKPERNGETAAKDAIAFRFIRHSGAYFDGTLDKSLRNEWRELMQIGTNEDFLSSFTYKLRELAPLFDALPQPPPPEMVYTTVRNFFDEAEHDVHRGTLEKMTKFYLSVVNTPFSNDDGTGDTRKNAYALLRLLTASLPAKK